MASKNVEYLRRTFYQLGTPQKREFIKRLDAQPASKKQPEYTALLSECIRVYNTELTMPKLAPAPRPVARSTAVAKPAAPAATSAKAHYQSLAPSYGRTQPSLAHSHGRTTPPIAPLREEVPPPIVRQPPYTVITQLKGSYIVCEGCEERLDAGEEICPYCGVDPITGEEPIDPADSTDEHYDEPQYPSYTVFTEQPFINHDPGSFTGRLHSVGKSPMFLAGIILWSAGSVLSALFNLSLFTIITLSLLALPVIGFFMMYAAAAAPKFPEKTLTSLMLFKVSAWVQLAGIGVIGLVAVIGFVWVIIPNFPTQVVVLFGIMLLIVAVILDIYYMSLFRILKDMREGITSNVLEPLRGVMPFTLLSCVFAAISVFGSIFTVIFGNAFARVISGNTTDVLPSAIADLINAATPSVGISVLRMLATMATVTGLGICLAMLNKFNNYLRTWRY